MAESTANTSTSPAPASGGGERAVPQAPWWRVRARTWFGSLALLALVLQAATGILMAFRYQPTPDHAYASVYYITNLVPYGWLVRTIHARGATLLIVLGAAHALDLFVAARYKHPREANWLIGVAAFLAAIAAAFTGHLLPWDQKAYWSTEAGVSLLRAAPLAGPWLARHALGSETLGEPALVRFYAGHVTVLPAILFGLLVAHLAIVRRQRMRGAAETPGPSLIAEESESRRPRRRLADLVGSAATAAVLLLCVYGALAIVAPVALAMKADPALALAETRPVWFLLSLHALTRSLPAPVAVTLPFVLGILVAFLPYLDRNLSEKVRGRLLVLGIGIAVVGGVLALTIVGAFV